LIVTGRIALVDGAVQLDGVPLPIPLQLPANNVFA
jgi:hypothetical protein